jgi:hypothetical protein
MDKNVVKLNPCYFWDIDFTKIDLDTNKRLIIERVICFGNLSELSFIIDYYGKKEIVNTICSLNYIDNKTLNFYSIYFKIPKINFKCFIRKQLIPQHWS